MYPSDYAYATSGGSTVNRITCLSTKLYSWNGSSASDCYTNDWMYNNTTPQWTLSPAALSSGAVSIFRVGIISSPGHMGCANTAHTYSLSPTLYLKSNVNIISGTGEESNPYRASLE